MAPPPPVHPIPCARPAWVFRGNRPSPRPRPSPLAAPSPCGPAVPRTAAHGRLARCVVVGLRRSTVVMPVLRSEEGHSRLAQESAYGSPGTTECGLCSHDRAGAERAREHAPSPP